MEKTIAILGSTGSIGTQTLEVVRENKDIRVAGLSAGSNITLLEKQIREFHPSLAAVWDEEQAKILAGRVSDLEVKVVSGMDGLLELAQMEESQILVTAIVGMIGIRPTIAAIQAGKDIALANKETLVTAGHLIMPMAREKGVQILPVDSEHSAIFQAIHGEDKREIHKLLITASGGPFRGKKREDLEHVKVEDALKHPNWKMGPKITVDCATLMNKGLEVIEAMRLYGLPLEQVTAIIHRQSVIHSLVEFVDGAVMAQLGVPDMRIPIQYALTWPDRLPSPVPELDFAALKHLSFDVADDETFRCLAAAKKAIRKGGLGPCAANGANEEAVRLFLQDKIGFLDIGRLVEGMVDSDSFGGDYTLQDVYDCDRMARDYVKAHV